MCGLLGLLTAGADAATRVDPIADGLRCARHRGPDESETWNDHDLVLGFNRLSIIDVDHSHQPLHWGPVPGEDTRYTIVFNGEIYNYLELREELIETYDAAFATDGDGEVIVAALRIVGQRAGDAGRRVAEARRGAVAAGAGRCVAGWRGGAACGYDGFWRSTGWW